MSVADNFSSTSTDQFISLPVFIRLLKIL